MSYNKREKNRTIMGEKIQGETENGSERENRRGESVCGGVKVMRACRGKREQKMGEKSRWYFISLH